MHDFQFDTENEKIKLCSFTLFRLQIGGAFLGKIYHKGQPRIIVK